MVPNFLGHPVSLNADVMQNRLFTVTFYQRQVVCSVVRPKCCSAKRFVGDVAKYCSDVGYTMLSLSSTQKISSSSS